MSPLVVQITDAGLAAIQALSGTDKVVISEMGLSSTPFTAAPTLTALPGEFKRISSVAGDEVAPTITHLTAYDTSTDVWVATGLGLYLDDGTLFAVFSDDTAIISKAGPSFALIACDIAFSTDLAASISFGQPIFTVPPATTETRGIVELATEEEAQQGLDDQRALTPATAVELLRSFLPVGFTALWSGTEATVPAGWAICDGREVERSDGTGTIITPDWTDRVPVGAGGDRAVGDLFGATEKTVNSAAGGAHTPTGKLQAGQTTESKVTGITLNTPIDNGTAQGGTGARVVSVAVNDPGHVHNLGELPLTMQQVPAHQHAVTVDVTQPSVALYFIMRV
ncbi:phage tail protein [Sphingomonas psychrotolerans]|uniref:Phage tail protein n=1 Tax=Sphingomonas psychrotolerans TaxID=1327635 RepID=A0ABU3N402_9SPHN|nr:hypothetical protein [Sphingomonas psychrotolerans]MDT8758236.1 phage tail protein [Sphingomonas psychrotolerans]